MCWRFKNWMVFLCSLLAFSIDWIDSRWLELSFSSISIFCWSSSNLSSVLLRVDGITRHNVRGMRLMKVDITKNKESSNPPTCCSEDSRIVSYSCEAYWHSLRIESALYNWHFLFLLYRPFLGSSQTVLRHCSVGYMIQRYSVI